MISDSYQLLEGHWPQQKVCTPGWLALVQVQVHDPPLPLKSAATLCFLVAVLNLWRCQGGQPAKVFTIEAAQRPSSPSKTSAVSAAF